MSLFLYGSVLIWFLARLRQTGTGLVMGSVCPVICLWDGRREECVIVLLTFFKEINMIFSLFGAPMGMSVPAHLFCRILSGGEDIVLLMLLKERDINFYLFLGVLARFILRVWKSAFCGI